ncbi:NUDIX domain-containing protein [Streptomyces sp. XD-27]|uniref:NUDIX domain-containing protein n=1 Tax=Streptomyces sp. XD-27 TaxID=3062779 RepID=UPI0026F4349B|nr:NUDIX domain-containing protein [Streptomyces sp. XD-27]WKX71605.1 NUDIX domain-containing protein [Streptomyces sp. XD-27]
MLARVEGNEITGTAALIVSSRGEYLLHLRDNLPHVFQGGRWALLGGAPEPGESPGDAIVRELAEEAVGLTVTGLEPFVVQENTGADGTTRLVQVYTGRWDGDPDELVLTEGVMLRWFPADMMPRLAMCPATQEVINEHQATALAR